VPPKFTAQERWIQMRQAAGYRSDAALERAAGVSPKQIWRWVHMGRDPELHALRELKRLMGVSLDALDATIVAMRKEAARAKQAPIASGGGPPG